MAINRKKLFVGLLDKDQWNVDRLRAYLTKTCCSADDDDEYIVGCEIMSYTEAKFQEKCFAFVTFTKEACVNRSIAQRLKFHHDYGLTVKRLLPATMAKCFRLISTTEVLIRIYKPDPLFTDENIRSYLKKYGNIANVKMLEEEEYSGVCLLTFEDFDSTDRVLLDLPHCLNGQTLLIDKYADPEHILNLSQFRFIEDKCSLDAKRAFSLLRNLTEIKGPLKDMYKTKLALAKYEGIATIASQEKLVDKAKEDLNELEKKYTILKQNFNQIYDAKHKMIEQIKTSQEITKNRILQYEKEIEQQKKQNEILRNRIN